MKATPGFLRLNRLRVLSGRDAVYDEQFHEGVNIIRGQNGSGKSTIADFIFFVLGGEFEDWKEAAGRCDGVEAELETLRGTLTLRRSVGSSLERVLVYFGSLAEASESSIEGWEEFPIRRQSSRESFSQVMFRSAGIPEAQSEGAANVTMHQILRLCYSDQRTPAARLFRFETFDTRSIREAVGDLVCGISGYEAYEIRLELREKRKELGEIEGRLHALESVLPADGSRNTPEAVRGRIRELKDEGDRLRREIEAVDEMVEPGEVKEYLRERKRAQAVLMKERERIKNLELAQENIEFELREIASFLDFLDELKEKIGFAEATSDLIGPIEFRYCPACGQGLDPEVAGGHCVVCKSAVDGEVEGARYNEIRLDVAIQMRESRQLTRQKQAELSETRREVRQARREHEKALASFDLEYAGGKGPREAFLALRTNRLGRIDAEVDFLTRSLDFAMEVEQLREGKATLGRNVDVLEARERALQREAERRRPRALGWVSDLAASVLRSDLPRQAEFQTAKAVAIDFRSDSISVGGSMNFAESSNVILKNAAVLGLFLGACADPDFFHPRFLLIDNVEDKGMEEVRSHKFQHVVVERVSKLGLPCQVIFTTSMMSPALEEKGYTVGPAYTSANRCLAFTGQGDDVVGSGGPVSEARQER